MKNLDITRKIVNSLCMVLCTLTVAMLITFAIDSSKKEPNIPKSTISPSVSPTQEVNLNGHTIVIDAGHGGKDGGAVGASTDTPEAILNLKVAKALEKILKDYGFTVIMTRENDDALGKTKMADMQKRKEIMNADGVDAVVSIHMNKFNCTHMI